MARSLPTRIEVVSKLEAMRSAYQTREEVAAWAVSNIDDDAVEVTDATVWKVLKSIGGADLIGEGGSYLFGNEDFDEWERTLAV